MYLVYTLKFLLATTHCTGNIACMIVVGRVDKINETGMSRVTAICTYGIEVEITPPPFSHLLHDPEVAD
jgi:hypothetical protein